MTPQTDVTKTRGDFWFPAKRYGWGWGFPVRWQGWVVMVGYCALVLAGIPLIQHRVGDGAYVAFLLPLTALFCFVCWWKGEPLRRRNDAARDTDRRG